MALIDYLGQNYSSQGSQAGGSTTAQQNLYNPQQQGLQGGLGGFYQQLLQGNIPQSFTNPSAPMAAYNANFDNNIMPQIAAQYGAGSPVGLSQKALGMQQLQGQLYNTGVNNFLNSLGSAGNYAFQSTGQTGGQSQFGATNQQGQNANTINPLFLLLSSLAGLA